MSKYAQRVITIANILSTGFLKREQFPWMFDVTNFAAQEAIIDLGGAFRAFLERRSNTPDSRKGRPSKFLCRQRDGTFRADGKCIELPVAGWGRMRETIRADRWFVSVTRARPVLAAVRPRPNRRCRSGFSNATIVDTRPGGIITPHGILKTWPRASRSQLVERNALARCESPAALPY